MNQIRQGDVLLVKRDKIVEKERTPEAIEDETVLAYGEATGHKHRFKRGVELHQAGWERDPRGSRLGSRLLDVRERLTTLLHEEHAKIDLVLKENEDRAQYDVVKQMEYTRSGRGFREVVD